jgi:hypothetical protein
MLSKCYFCFIRNKPFMLGVIMINVIVLSVIMLNVGMLNAVAPGIFIYLTCPVPVGEAGLEP